MPPQNRRTPQDRKPKTGTVPGEYTVTDGQFSFVGSDGKSHTLPPATEGLERLPFGEFRRAMSGGQANQAELAFRLLDALDVDDDTTAALDGLDTISGAKILGAWYAATGGDGVSVPQS